MISGPRSKGQPWGSDHDGWHKVCGACAEVRETVELVRAALQGECQCNFVGCVHDKIRTLAAKYPIYPKAQELKPQASPPPNNKCCSNGCAAWSCPNL